MGCGPTSKACGEGEAARHIGESCNDREWKGTGTGEAGCDQPGAPSAGAPLPPRPAPSGSPPPLTCSDMRFTAAVACREMRRRSTAQSQGLRSIDAAGWPCAAAYICAARVRRGPAAPARVQASRAMQQAGDGTAACAQEWAWAGWSDCWCANAWA